MSRRATALSIAWIVCLWAAGCGGGCSGSNAADPDPTATGESAEASGGEGAEGEVIDPGPRPELRVTGRPDPHDGHVGIRIENHGSEVVELAPQIVLQRARGEAFADVADVQLDMRFNCEEPAAGCVALAPGAVYLPPAWLGTSGASQCACEGCAAAGPGTYRFVVRSCNRAHQLEGEPFTR